MILDKYLETFKRSRVLASLPEEEADQWIEKLLEHLPFKIEAKSMEEKRIAYERISLLIDSETGKKLLFEAKKINQQYGKIIIKEEEHNEGDGFVSEKNPLIINMNPELKEKLKCKNGFLSDADRKEQEEELKREKGVSSASEDDILLWALCGDAIIQNKAAAILGHELQHVIQAHHPDHGISTSFEGSVKKTLLKEVEAKLIEICYRAEWGFKNDPLIRLYNEYFQRQKDLGQSDEMAKKSARTSMALLYITDGKIAGDSLDNDVKEEIHSWNECYKKTAFNRGLKTQFSFDSNAKEREQNYMNYLCDSCGIDRFVLVALEKSLDENHSGNKFVFENEIYEIKQEKGHTISSKKVRLNTCSLEFVFMDGHRLQYSCVYDDGDVEKKEYHPNECLKSEKIIKKGHGSKKTEFDEKGRKIKETQDWDGKIIKTVYDPESEKVISSKQVVSQKTLQKRLSQGIKESKYFRKQSDELSQ